MCGIAGLIDFNSTQPNETILRRMLGLIRHRAPMYPGMYLGSNAGLAHARLSIIDLSGGDQPIHNEDETVWVIYNGEIFNYPELRVLNLEAQQGIDSIPARTPKLSPTFMKTRGPDLFDGVNGQFAFAIWDQTNRRLVLGRDRLGIRPLFYYQDAGRLLFGSEIKSIFADPNVPRKFGFGGYSRYFYVLGAFRRRNGF